MKRSRSDLGSAGIRYRAVAFVALLFASAPLLAAIAPSVVTTDLFIVGEDDPINEDVYVASTSGRVEGIIDGDLVITTGDLSISGTVTGNVLALTSGTIRLEQGGVVEGSLRTTTPQVQIDGEIGEDLFVTGLAADVGPSGVIGRDIIMFGATLTVGGSVGRDVRGRLLNTSVSGTVGRDVDLAVQRLVVESGASVAGDVLYRSTSDAEIASGTVAGQVVQLPAQSNFIFGVILTLANIIGFLAFIVSGILLLWLFRATGAAAVEAVEKHPLKTGLVGLGTLIGAPLLILLLAATLVGLPLALLLMVALLLAFVFGPIPAVGAVGDLLLRRKGGLFGGFLIGAVLWRLGIWLIPFVGALIYLAGLIWGTGGWVLAAWRLRSSRPPEREALPAALIVKDEAPPEDWTYPLPPANPVPSTEGRGDAERSDDAGGQPSSSRSDGSDSDGVLSSSSPSGGVALPAPDHAARRLVESGFRRSEFPESLREPLLESGSFPGSLWPSGPERPVERRVGDRSADARARSGKATPPSGGGADEGGGGGQAPSPTGPADDGSPVPSTEGRGDAEERSDDAGGSETEAPDNDDRDLPTR